MCYFMLEAFNKADEIVAHNGDRFDIKWIRARAVFHGLEMRNHYNMIDTYKISKANLRIPSHSLKELCKYYLDNARIIEDGWINQEWVESNFKKLDSDLDVRYVNKFLGLLAFEIWYRIFVTKEMNSDVKLSA